MKVGLGTGRAAEHFVRALGARVKDGLAIVGVPTSERTRELAGDRWAFRSPPSTRRPRSTSSSTAPTRSTRKLRLIKGGGGALLREKIVASAARRMIIVAEGAKLVAVLGAFPLPIEVIPFGMTVTLRRDPAGGGRPRPFGEHRAAAARRKTLRHRQRKSYSRCILWPDSRSR